jgi:hypothetical protein
MVTRQQLYRCARAPLPTLPKDSHNNIDMQHEMSKIKGKSSEKIMNIENSDKGLCN